MAPLSDSAKAALGGVSVLLFAAVVALALRVAWNPPLRTYGEYVPIGALLAAMIGDRLASTRRLTPRAALCDAAVVLLALMRAVIPPWPFISGHALLAAYGVMSAQAWLLRAVATVVLLHVLYTKLFVTGGWRSMVGGIVAAALFAFWRGGKIYTPLAPRPR